MLFDCKVFIDRVVLWADPDLLEDVHDASIDFLAEKLDTS